MDQQAIAVHEMSQTGQARRRAADLAARLGFDSQESGRVGLVVTEVATNLVKHARGGEIVLCPVLEEVPPAVDIVALDRGPGIRDVDRALRDGYSTSGSMGSGLGAIMRLSSRFDLYSSDSGTIVLSRIGAPGAGGSATGGPGAAGSAIDVGAICVPCPGETVSGDAWSIAQGRDRTAVLVVDGLGHGQDAHEAAETAVRAFSAHAGDSPGSLIGRLHDALRPTRGAAAAILELDRSGRMARFAGVGNISAAVLSEGASRSMVSHHGTLGHVMRHVQEFDYPWPEGSLVILHSDGIGTHWDLARYPGLARRQPMLVAAALYRDFHRKRDDATVLALKEAA
jgi:anti-sigma regulatory factor (Ser/Thr protein kinase)